MSNAPFKPRSYGDAAVRMMHDLCAEHGRPDLAADFMRWGFYVNTAAAILEAGPAVVAAALLRQPTEARTQVAPAPSTQPAPKGNSWDQALAMYRK